MKKIFLSALFLLSTTSYSQELDEAYLESLPEEIRTDVLERIETKELTEKPVYRTASSAIDKNSSSSELFGSNFFDTVQTSFMPINEPNLDSTYVLDFGDIFDGCDVFCST